MTPKQQQWLIDTRVLPRSTRFDPVRDAMPAPVGMDQDPPSVETPLNRPGFTGGSNS